METFKSLREGTVLDALRDRNYKVYPEEIPGIIYSLYSYVGEDEDRIDEVIPVIELVAETSPAFKDEWYGAIEEAGGEVLEEGKLGKLATIAALALAAGISLTGCSPDVNIPPEVRVEAPYKAGVGDNMEIESKYPVLDELAKPGSEQYEHFEKSKAYTAYVEIPAEYRYDSRSWDITAYPMIEGVDGKDVLDRAEASPLAWQMNGNFVVVHLGVAEGTEFGVEIHIKGNKVLKDGSLESFEGTAHVSPEDKREGFNIQGFPNKVVTSIQF